jgi:Tfp pilus assembly protein PilO
MAADFQTTFRRYGRFYQSSRRYMQRKEVLVSTNVILTLFTVSFFAAFAIRPTALTITRLWREITDKREVRTQLEEKISSLEKAQASLIDVEDDLTLLNSALPPTPDFSRFLRIVEYLASTHSLLLNSSRFQDIELYVSEQAASAAAAEVVTHSFSLSLRGSFSNIRAFLADLQHLDRTISLRTVSIRGSKKQEGADVFDLDFSVDADAFSYPEGSIPEKR